MLPFWSEAHGDKRDGQGLRQEIEEPAGGGGQRRQPVADDGCGVDLRPTLETFVKGRGRGQFLEGDGHLMHRPVTDPLAGRNPHLVQAAEPDTVAAGG